jgi:hypothetical protein
VFFEMHVACHDCKLLLSLSGGFSVGGRHGCFAALAAKKPRRFSHLTLFLYIACEMSYAERVSVGAPAGAMKPRTPKAMIYDRT